MSIVAATATSSAIRSSSGVAVKTNKFSLLLLLDEDVVDLEDGCVCVCVVVVAENKISLPRVLTTSDIHTNRVFAFEDN